MKIFKSNMKLMVFTSPLSYNMTIAGASQIPRSKLQGIKLSQHSPNGCAYTSAWPIARGKKNRRLHYELRTKLTIFKKTGQHHTRTTGGIFRSIKTVCLQWESDTTYPEMDKLLQLANLFHCSLDDLVQKDISSQYVEDKCNYDQFMNQFSRRITTGVGLILSGVTIMLLLNTFIPKVHGFDMEEFSGIIFLFFVIAAVAIFIVSGLQRSYFEKKYPYIENFYSDEEKETFHKKLIQFITTGVVLIIFGMILAVTLDAVISANHMIRNRIDFDALGGAIFMFLVTIAVILFVYAGTQDSKYNIERYNLMHDHNSQTYKNDKKIGVICGSIMMVATMIFLGCGLLGKLWHIAWVVYPVFGIACGIVSMVINHNNEEEN